MPTRGILTTRSTKDLKLLLAFVVVFSMLTLPGSLGGRSYLPQIHVTAASVAPNEPWYPAGPSMDKLVYRVYTDSTAEQVDLQNGFIDIPDTPIAPSQIPITCSGPTIQCTGQVPFTGYFELEFHLGQRFWGCQMNFGNSICGVNIRQGIAHGLDKLIFVNSEPSLGGTGVAIDNPVPPSVNLVSPNTCGWDSAHIQSSTNCVVGAPGGTAYHLAMAATGSGCTNTPSFPFTPGCSTPDFCAAADHFIVAGLATGKNPSTCVLTGISSNVTSSPINFFVRNDDAARLHMGQGYAQFVCALFTGAFTTSCGISPSATNIVSVTFGTITTFPGFNTSTTSVSLNWWVYTGGFSEVQTIDASLYYRYNSLFVSGIPAIQPPNGPCSTQSAPSSSASNYMYLCSPNYDNISNQTEFAPCLTAPGDPTPGVPNPTFSRCPGTAQLTAASAAYQAQDVFGQNAFTIPVWTPSNRFAYLSNWQRAVLQNGNGFIPPGNTVAEFNAYNSNPAVPDTIRQGYSQPASSVNPFIATTLHDLGLVDNIWDSPYRLNPSQPSTTLEWMTISTRQLAPSALGYTPPTGTVAAFRFALRNDLFWHTGQKVTAWDLAFSYIALKATGASLGSKLYAVIGVKVISPSQVDVDVNGIGLFTKPYVGSTIVFPGRFWSSCGASTWDASANTQDFATSNAALTPCIGPNVTSAGVLLPSASTVDPAKVLPSYDPLAAGTLVGSGPWVCVGPMVGLGCSSSGQTGVPPGGTYSLLRNGLGTTPGASLNSYFRSSGNLALWAWSGNNGDFAHDFINFSVVARCVGKAVTGGSTGCGHWQQGIGGDVNGAATKVDVPQIGIVSRFVGVNWIAPFNWITSPPQGIAAFPPVLFEGSNTLNPASIVGCNLAYPSGGYDC